MGGHGIVLDAAFDDVGQPLQFFHIERPQHASVRKPCTCPSEPSGHAAYRWRSSPATRSAPAGSMMNVVTIAGLRVGLDDGAAGIRLGDDAARHARRAERRASRSGSRCRRRCPLVHRQPLEHPRRHDAPVAVVIVGDHRGIGCGRAAIRRDMAMIDSHHGIHRSRNDQAATGQRPFGLGQLRGVERLDLEAAGLEDPRPALAPRPGRRSHRRPAARSPPRPRSRRTARHSSPSNTVAVDPSG